MTTTPTTARLAEGATDRLARFTADMDAHLLPGESLDSYRRCLIDFLGCTIYGSTLEWSRIVRDFALEESAVRTSVIIGTDALASPAQAALANGIAGHAFEIDDLHEAGCIHPAAVAFPAAFAVADPHETSGADLMAAVVAGYEVGIRVGEVLGIPHFLRGFHPQGTAGVFAAAAAASRMLGLDPLRTRHAFAIAASQGAGLMSAQSGGMVKRFHSGRAAQAGVVSALLAQRGMTGTPDPLEAEFGGFLTSLQGETFVPEALEAGLGEEWRISEVGFKPYASCAVIHPSIALLREIMDSTGSGFADIERVDVDVTTDAHVHCAFDIDSYDTINAQMSFFFALAVAAVRGETGGAAFAESRLTDPEVLEFARRVHVHPSTEYDRMGERFRFATRVAVTTRNGITTELSSLYRPGSPDLALSDDQLRAKFSELASEVPGIDPAQVLAAVDALAGSPTLEPLIAALTPGESR